MLPTFALTRWREAIDARRCAATAAVALRASLLLLLVFGGSLGAQVLTPELRLADDAELGSAVLLSSALTVVSGAATASLFFAARRHGAVGAEADLQAAFLAAVYGERAPEWMDAALPFMEAHFR